MISKRGGSMQGPDDGYQCGRQTPAQAATADEFTRRRKTPFLWRAVGVLALSFCAVPAWSAAGALASDVADASAGYFQLAWHADEPVRLVESQSATFTNSRTIYDGADTARIMSGKPDGDWFYRLEATSSGAVAAGPIRVRVRHHPLRRAFSFFGLGAAVFVATLGLILVGIRANRI